MKNILAKQLIKKILKQADMPLPGASYTSKRTQEHGLKFNIFNRNALTQKLIDMPEDIKLSLTKKLEDFYKSFAVYLKTDAEKKKFSGMLRIAVAKDTHVTKDVVADLVKSSPVLAETASFVDRYNIQLTPESETLKSRLSKDREGNVIQKGIGSDYWFRVFGYAYWDMMNNGAPLQVERLRNASTREIGPNVTEQEFNSSVNGRFAIGKVNNGYTFVIVKDDSRFVNEDGDRDRESMLIFEPGSQIASQMQSKWFEQAIDIGRSCILLDGPLDSTNLISINCTAAQKLKIDNPAQFAKVWKIFADENTGAFYLQKQNNFGAGRGERTFTSERLYLTKEQVQVLAKQNLLGKMFRVKPANVGDIDVAGKHMSFADMRDEYKYVYNFDEATKKKLLEAQPGSAEYAYSIPALKAFKKYLDDRAIASSQNELTGAHTALEGYIFFMMGPIFVSPKNIGPGKTKGGVFTTQHEYVADPSQPLNVDRVKFGVFTQSVSPTRWEFAERLTPGGKHRMPPWRTVAVADTFNEALLIMKNMITGMGARYEEDDTGEVVAVDLLPALAPSKSTEIAQKAFERFIGDKNEKEQENKQQVIEPNNKNQP